MAGAVQAGQGCRAVAGRDVHGPRTHPAAQRTMGRHSCGQTDGRQSVGSGARKQAEGRAANGLAWPWITPSARLHTNLPCPQVGASMAVPPWVTFSPTNGPLTVLPCTQGWPAYLLLGTHTPRLSPAVGPRGQTVIQHRSLLGSRGRAGSLGVLGGGQAWLAQSYV